MIKQIRSVLFNQIHKRKRFPGLLTSKKELLSLIKLLKPIKTDKDLIRLGPEGDGGYLVPNDLEGITVLLSPGVDQESRFELECAEKGMKVHMMDASVSKPATTHPQFNFHKVFLGIGKNEITLDKFCSDQGLDDLPGDWMLQMDIEGAEWETLIHLSPERLKRFRILVIEFHDLDNLFNLPFFNIANKVFRKVLETHSLVHLHPNNIHPGEKVLGIEIPRYMEFTFLRKDRINKSRPATQFPHALDRECSENPAIPLPKIWYQ